MEITKHDASSSCDTSSRRTRCTWHGAPNTLDMLARVDLFAKARFTKRVQMIALVIVVFPFHIALENRRSLGSPHRWKRNTTQKQLLRSESGQFKKRFKSFATKHKVALQLQIYLSIITQLIGVERRLFMLNYITCCFDGCAPWNVAECKAESSPWPYQTQSGIDSKCCVWEPRCMEKPHGQ